MSGCWPPTEGLGLAPPLIVGEHVVVLHAAARLGHHLGHGIAPGLVVSGLFVATRVFDRAVYLDQHESSGVIRLLNHVEAGDAGLLHAVARVLQRRFLEGSDKLGLDVHVYVDDVDKHFEKTKGAGAKILAQPEDKLYGDRTYSAEDLEGHHWYFAQHVRDVAPEDMKPPA